MTLAFYGEGLNVAVPVAADLSALQFTPVTLNSGGQAAQATSGSAPCLGVLMNKPKSTDIAQVRFYGVCKVVLGATVAAGAQIMPTTGGQVITCTSSNYPLGVLLTGGVTGDTQTALICPSQTHI